MKTSANVSPDLVLTGWRTWIAKRISDLLSPPILTGGLAVLFTRLATPTWTLAFIWSALYVVLADLLPLAYLIRLLRKGIVSDLHLGIRAERIRPLLVTMICLAAAFAGALLLQAPRTLLVFLGLSLIQGLILTAVTTIWQISFHAAAATALIAASGVIYGAIAALVLIPILIVVGWSRMHLRRHTFRQIAAGAIIAGTLFGPVLAQTLP
jgi:hypothetical protein